MNQQAQQDPQLSQLSFPEIDATFVPVPAPKADDVKPVTEQDLWNHLLANIDDFAVAKSIVDFLDTASADLQQQHTVLYLRAKVTIKRNQIAYAEANKAVDNARKSSSARILASLDRVLHGVDKRLSGVMLKPMPLGVAIAAALVASVTWLR